MLCEQFVCGSSKAVLLILLLVSSVSGALYGGPGSGGECISEPTAEPVVTKWRPEEFGGHDSEFLRAAYEELSQDVRYIVEFLKDPNYALGEEDRFSVFYGGPGTGKTVQSYVVPYMAGWHCAPRVPSQVQVRERNGTAQNLADDIARALEPGEKVVYVMQEFNKLVDHPKSTSHDADTASAALWTALDEHNRNPNFYFIGTTNNLENIAEQLKDRFLPQIVEFQGLQTEEAKKRALMRHVFSTRVSRASDCTDAFIDDVVRECSVETAQHEGSHMSEEDKKGWAACSTHRDFRALGILARRFARFDNTTGYNAEVAEQHIKAARARMKRAKELCRYGKQEETDQEQRQRHHEYSLAQQETHHARTVDQTYQLHGLSLAQEILRSHHTTPLGSISRNGVVDLVLAQPEKR